MSRFRVRQRNFVLDHRGWVFNSNKPKIIKRYYNFKEKHYGDGNIVVHTEDNCLTQNKLLLKISNKKEEADEKVELNSIKCENNLTLITAEYNKQLLEHPFDIDLWIKFVNHQVRFYLCNVCVE